MGPTLTHKKETGRSRAPRLVESAQQLEADAEGTLYQAGFIRLNRGLSEAGVVGLCDRGAKLCAVEDVEELNAELSSELFVDGCVLYN